MITFMNGNIFDGFCDMICHQVNCQGIMGAGIAKEIRERFPMVYKKFRNTYKAKKNKLGNIDIVDVCNSQRYVINMYSQDNYLPRGIQHTNYNAFKACLLKIKDAFYAKRNEITIGFPYKIGCGLGGGDWNTILGLIDEVFKDSPTQLPSSVTLHLTKNDKKDDDFLDNESEYISDLLTDKYGFCHNGFKYEIKGNTVVCTDINWDIEDDMNHEWSIEIWKLN